MRRRCGLIERIDRDWTEDAELHRQRLLECRAALRLRHVMGERRPGQGHARALRLGCGGLRFCAADGGHAAFAARNALGRFVQIADRALAAHRAVIAMRRLDAEPLGEQLLGIAVAPAQEVDDVERADFLKQFCPGVGFGALQRLFQQYERLKAFRNLFRPVDDLADADDDGNAVFGEGGFAAFHFFSFALRHLLSRHCERSEAIHRAASGDMDCFVASLLAMTRERTQSATSAFMCSIASIKSCLNSCTTLPADFTLSISPTPWPTKYDTRSRARGLPAAAARSIAWKASRLMMLCSGIGSAPGLSGSRSQASVQTERNCRAGFPVRPFERTASREEAAIIFARKISDVSDSTVASHTEPVQTPAAPIAMQAAICRPVMMPPAASTGTSRIGLIALITSGTSTMVETSPQWPPASVPCTTRMSTPAATCRSACSLAPTSAATGTPCFLPRSIISFGGTPSAFAINFMGWRKETSSSSSAVAASKGCGWLSATFVV